MEVILLESFDRLGQIGDVVKVKNGFARNYLIPQKKALRANNENKEKFQKIKDELISKNREIIEKSKKVIKEIEKKEIIFVRNASDNGQLYGSVSPKDISNYFIEKKVDIKPANINLHSSIKKIGIYDLNIKLHAEVGCNLQLNVATSEENAKKQRDELENHNNKKDTSTDDKFEVKPKDVNAETTNVDKVDKPFNESKSLEQEVKVNSLKTSNDDSQNIASTEVSAED
ncbi:MAG: 50S ribosomal protein L9 [Pelagibacteraceae bacterium TMED65]|nr:50S ribosomal protein L9 [Rickettsiales bacterium]OUU51418.1 MAG: 50S ribosomal protein L9 [Pelagibacteraceae bacterium TMED65]